MVPYHLSEPHRLLRFTSYRYCASYVSLHAATGAFCQETLSDTGQPEPPSPPPPPLPTDTLCHFVVIMLHYLYERHRGRELRIPTRRPQRSSLFRFLGPPSKMASSTCTFLSLPLGSLPLSHSLRHSACPGGLGPDLTNTLNTTCREHAPVMISIHVQDYPPSLVQVVSTKQDPALANK
ncbi:hypothetical protein CTA2_11407 [Colletotrichum tanaceti]|nr:hypothetical protein CTA2_11407 [Colletotrichum tanaceti]